MTYGDFQQKKENKIHLGQAKNQASTRLVNYYGTEQEIQEQYKKWVKRFYAWNKEIDKEIMGE
ncbi:MAG TPA: hypothetical protein VJ201_04220 [Candidatus Babeliales bacterium]|nr:hypothetical protein [Candidatus Babeliales bacterium]